MSVLINPYCSLTDLKTFLKLPLADTANDDVLIDAINEASRFIEDETYDRFYKQSYVDKYVDFQSAGRNNFTIFRPVRNVQSGFIQTPYKPIISITSIDIATQYPLAGAMTRLTEGVGYTVDYDNGLIYRVGDAWPTLPNSIKITCDLGYDNGTDPYDNSIVADTVPGLIRKHCRLIASVGLYRRDVYSSWTGQVSKISVTEIDDKWINALRHWRMRR
jgi:hypothetical protein